MPHVPAAEVAELLRKAISGQSKLTLANNSLLGWDRTYTGDVSFVIDGWRVTFFNDCDELDYCDSVKCPDGRSASFDDWWKTDERDPSCHLSIDELTELEKLLKKAR